MACNHIKPIVKMASNGTNHDKNDNTSLLTTMLFMLFCIAQNGHSGSILIAADPKSIID